MKKNGFTLIELMVGVGLVAVITSFGVASFRTSSRKQAVDVAADRLRQVLLQARSNALYGKKDDVTCGASRPLEGWEVRVANRTLILRGWCGGVQFSASPSQTYAATTVTVSPVGVRLFMFRPLGQGSSLEDTYYFSDATVPVPTRAVSVTLKGDIN